MMMGIKCNGRFIDACLNQHFIGITDYHHRHGENSDEEEIFIAYCYVFFNVL